MRSYTRGRLIRLALVITLALMLAGPTLPFRSAAQSGDMPPPSAGRNATGWLIGSPVGLHLNVASNGLVVGAMKSGDAAERCGLRQGDRVLRVDDQSFKSAEAAAEEIQTAWNAGKSAVDLVVSRGSQELYVALRLR